MKKMTLVPNEKFCSEDENQRKERFQEEFGQYILDALSAADFSKSDTPDLTSLRIGTECRTLGSGNRTRMER